jgi:hypothetical protein
MRLVIMRPTRLIGVLFVWLVAAGSVWVASSAAATGMASRDTVPGQEGAQRVTLHIAIGSESMTATLEDNPTARDFAALLPLTVTLREFSPAEKVSGALPRRLSEEGAPATDAGAVGDIAYYAPWGNIAFYRGRGPDAAGVIKIARITSGMEALQHTGQVRVTISRAK